MPGVQHVPQERVPNPVVEQIGGVPVPQMEVTQHVPQERERVVEQIGCVAVPKIKEDVVDGFHVVPQEPRKKPRFAAEHWECQVLWESVHCEDASSPW